jgi:hypothetical protein
MRSVGWAKAERGPLANSQFGALVPPGAGVSAAVKARAARALV